MIIVLSCEILNKIAFSKNSLHDQCKSLINELLDLGKTICMKTDEEDKFYDQFTDTDF